jgi:hypothetical protein
VKKIKQTIIVILTVVSILLVGIPKMKVSAEDIPVRSGMNQDFAQNGFRRIIDHEHPVLTFTMVMGHNTENDSDFLRDINYRGQDIKQMWETIPQDIRPYCVLTLHFGSVYNKWNTTADARKWVEDNLLQGQDLGIPMMVIYGGNRSQAMAGSQEDTFKWIQSLYDTYDNFIGTTSSEQTDADVTAAVPGLVKLAAQNGGYHIHANQETINQFYSKIVANKANGDILRKYHENFIYTPKNVHCNYDYNFSEAYGMWLADMSAGFGTYVDAYNWYQAATTGGETPYATTYSDYVTRAFPESAYAVNMIENALNGATVFQYENQMDIPATNSMYSPLFWNAMVPAMRTIIQTIDIPAKEECIEKSKIGFYEDSNQKGLPADCGSRGTYNGSGMLNVGSDGESTTFFEGLYDGGIDMYNSGNSNLRYFFRTSGRYGIIPQIPIYTPEETLNTLKDAGMTIIDCDYYLKNFKSVQDKVDFFNEKYEEINTGDATVNKDKNSWQIYNNAVNEDRIQSAQVPLSSEGIYKAIDFQDMTPHSSATLAVKDGELIIDLNNYRTNRGAEGDLVSKDGGKRVLDVLDYYNEFKYCLDPSDKELRETKMVIHLNTDEKPQLDIGGYDRNQYTYEESWNPASREYSISVHHNGPVSIVLNASEAHWTAADESDIKNEGSNTELKFYGTSIQWKGNSAANISIDGIAWANGVDSFHKTGLSNAYHTITVEGDSSGSFRYIRGTTQMLTDSYLQDFTYASREEDQDYYVDSEHWTVTKEDTYEPNEPVSYKGKVYQTFNKTGKNENGVMKILPYVAPFWSDIPIYMTQNSYTDAEWEADFNTAAGTPVSFAFRTDIQYKRGYYITVNPLRLNPTNAGTNYQSLALLDGTKCQETADPDLEKNTWYTIKIQVQGPDVKVFLKEREEKEYGDAVLAYTGLQQKEGYFGVRAEHNSGKDTGEGIGNAIAVQEKGSMNDFIYIDNVRITDANDAGRNYSCEFETKKSAENWKGEGAVLFSARQPETGFGYADEWEKSGGTWKTEAGQDIWANGDNGVYTGEAEAGKENYSYAGSQEWKDYLYNSLLKFNENAKNESGILFRVQDEENMYKLSVCQDGTAAELQFMKKTGGAWENIGETKSIPMESGKWYAFNLTVMDEFFGLSVNDNHIMTVRDTAFRSGKAGFSVNAGTKAYFDNAWVSVLHTEPLNEVPVTSISISGPETADAGDLTQELLYESDQHVTWDTSDHSKALITDEGRLIPVSNGAVSVIAKAPDGSGVQAEKEVTIVNAKDSPVIISMETQYLTTERNQVPDMPEKVQALYSDGTEKEVEVLWDAAAPESFKDAVGPMFNWDGGKATVYGTAEENRAVVKADVTILPEPLLDTASVSPNRGSDVPFDTGIINNKDNPQEIALGETIDLPRIHYLKMEYQCGDDTRFTDPYSFVWWEKSGMEVTEENYKPGDSIEVVGHVGKYGNKISTHYTVMSERKAETAVYKVEPENSGTVSGPAEIGAGKKAEVKAQAASGYQFGYWTITDNKTGNETVVERTRETMAVIGTAEAMNTYTAHFVKSMKTDEKTIRSVNGDFEYLYPYAQVALTVENGEVSDYEWSVEGAAGTANDAGKSGKAPGKEVAQTNISEEGILSLTSDETGTLTVIATPKNQEESLEVLRKEIHIKSEEEVTLIDDNDATDNLLYSPSEESGTWAVWTGGNQYNRYNKTEHKWNNTTADGNSYASLTFEGTGIQVITESGTNQGGSADIYLDHVYQGEYSVTLKNAGANMYHYVFFATEGLENGSHTLEIVPRAEPNKYRIPLDAFVITQAKTENPGGDIRSIQAVSGNFEYLYPYAQIALRVENGDVKEYNWSVSGDTGEAADAGGKDGKPSAAGQKTNITDMGILSLSSDAKGLITITAVPKDEAAGLETLTKTVRVEESEQVVLIDDDREDVITYSPSVGNTAWAKWSGGTQYNRYNKTEHKWNNTITDENSYAQFTFNGTGIQVITDSGSGSGGFADVYIDGEHQGEYNVFTKNGNAEMYHYVFFTAEGLENKEHTIKVVPKTAPGKYRLTLDGFVVTNSENEPEEPVLPEITEITPEEGSMEKTNIFQRFHDTLFSTCNDDEVYEIVIHAANVQSIKYQFAGWEGTEDEPADPGMAEVADGKAIVPVRGDFAGTIHITAENDAGDAQRTIFIHHDKESPGIEISSMLTVNPDSKTNPEGLEVNTSDNLGVQRVSYILTKDGEAQPENILYEDANEGGERPDLPENVVGTDGRILEENDIYTGIAFSLPFVSDGTYKLTVMSTDYCGNTSVLESDTIRVGEKTSVQAVNVEMQGGTYRKQPFGFTLTEGEKIQWSDEYGNIAEIEDSDVQILYQGREGTQYESSEPPAEAGKYRLILSVDENNETYSGTKITDFEIQKAEATVTALDKEIKEGEQLPDVSMPDEEKDYTVQGVLSGDTLEGSLLLNYTDEDGNPLSSDIPKAGEYSIVPSGLEGGNNYKITFINGKLTVKADEKQPDNPEKPDIPDTEDPGQAPPDAEDPGQNPPETENPGQNSPDTEEPGQGDLNVEEPEKNDPGVEKPGQNVPGTANSGNSRTESNEKNNNSSIRTGDNQKLGIYVGSMTAAVVLSVLSIIWRLTRKKKNK